MTGPTVLAIEDEPLILDAIQDAMTEGGYVVMACSAASDALRYLEEESAQFVGLVTDIRFAGEKLTGWDVARRAREIFPSIGVVYMSGDSGVDWRAQGVPDSTFIQKPFASAQIVTAISHAINSSGSAAPDA